MAAGPGGLVAQVELVGGPELIAAFQQLTGQPPEFIEAQNNAGALIANEAKSLAPSVSGTMASYIGFRVSGNLVDIGSYSPYARWFHVPYLSEGGVQYAKKISSAGREYGQRIPNNPWLINAAFTKQVEAFGQYVLGIGRWIDSVMAGVPRGS